MKEIKSEKEESLLSITDSEMIKELINMTLDQNLLTINDKKLAKDSIRDIKEILINYLNNKEKKRLVS